MFVRIAAVFCFLGVALGVQRKTDFTHLFSAGFLGRRAREKEREEERNKEKENGASVQPVTQILLDTSAIIDGRIADISQTGFVSGALVVPRFVLNELQRIADSAVGPRDQGSGHGFGSYGRKEAARRKEG